MGNCAKDRTLNPTQITKVIAATQDRISTSGKRWNQTQITSKAIAAAQGNHNVLFDKMTKYSPLFNHKFSSTIS